MCEKLVILIPFLFPPKKGGNNERRKNWQTGFQQFFIALKIFTIKIVF